MKKFERLSSDARKKEIKAAAAALFVEKGFADTTMENIIDRVSLSKGGVYRLYPSSSSILSDLMIDGMRLRNSFYVERLKSILADGKMVTLKSITDMICDSLLLYPELSAVYAEFLIAKRRNPELEQRYRKICETTVGETGELMRACRIDELIPEIAASFDLLTDLMNTAILGICTLKLQEPFRKNKELISSVIASLLSEKAGKMKQDF